MLYNCHYNAFYQINHKIAHGTLHLPAECTKPTSYAYSSLRKPLHPPISASFAELCSKIQRLKGRALE